MSVEMRIDRVALDPVTNMPIVLLKEATGSRVLPIWIGLLEASSIATKLEQVEVGRPMTHDLLAHLVGLLGARIERVTVVDLRDNTFFATISVEAAGRRHELDSRPSDAIAVALRVECPVFVEEQVLERSKVADEAASEPELDPRDAEKVAEFLENLPADQFGKYKM